jgi:L,D-transpeptidase catalytic domain
MSLYNPLFKVCFLVCIAFAFKHDASLISINTDRTKNHPTASPGKNIPLTPAIEWKIQNQAAALKKFALVNGYDTCRAILIDMSLPSAKKRFFYCNIDKGAILESGLVAHGMSKNWEKEGPVFSNVPGSLCTSVGRYKIGSSYYGQFGLAYKLHGLDQTNNNAYERAVVLHAHSCVPDVETEEPICRSYGCPTISPNLLAQLKPVLDKAKRPVLLWIFE